MKLLFIYDSPLIKEIGKIIDSVPDSDHVHILTSEPGRKKSLHETAETIKKITSVENNCIIFINQYLACADKEYEWLQNNAGIALVKFLRLLDVKCHIVLITPLISWSLIKQHPGNLILSSRGITIAKSLYEFSKKTIDELEILSNHIFDERQDIKPYILSEFRLPEDERHNWANWWGIVQMTDAHRTLYTSELNYLVSLGKNYPGCIDDELKHLRNIQALRLYRHKVDFKKVIDDEVLSKFNSKKRTLTSEIERLKKQIEGVGKKNPKPDEWADFIKDREKIIEENLNNRKFNKQLIVDQINRAKKQKEAGKDELIVKEKKLIELENELNELQTRKFNFSEEFKKEVSSFRVKNREPVPKIIYIDDQGDEGWSEIFQFILYGQKTDSFISISECKDDVELLYNELHEKIVDFNPDLILLDLRLQKEKGIIRDIIELSGAKLLKKIKSDFPGLPVMIVTASNKFWSMEQLQHLGCDAFWTKEGIDSYSNINDTINNYLKFVKLVFFLTGDDYGFLKWFSDEIEKIRITQNSFWWETSIHAKNGKVDKFQIVFILTNTMYLIRNYLKSKYNKSFENEGISNWLFPSLAIHNLGKIPELIYHTWNSEYMYDKTAKELYKKRNNASHIVQDYARINATDIIFTDVMEYIKQIIDYLNLKNNPPLARLKRKQLDTEVISQEELFKNVEISNKKKKYRK